MKPRFIEIFDKQGGSFFVNSNHIISIVPNNTKNENEGSHVTITQGGTNSVYGINTNLTYTQLKALLQD